MKYPYRVHRTTEFSNLYTGGVLSLFALHWGTIICREQEIDNVVQKRTGQIVK